MAGRKVKEDAVESKEEVVETPQPQYLKKEDVHYDSRYKDLRIFMYEEKADGKYKEHQIQFRNGSFRTNDTILIKLMEQNKVFGGTKSKDFEDAKSADPIYWRGGYPEWYVKKRSTDAENLSYDPEAYEKSYD